MLLRRFDGPTVQSRQNLLLCFMRAYSRDALSICTQRFNYAAMQRFFDLSCPVSLLKAFAYVNKTARRKSLL